MNTTTLEERTRSLLGCWRDTPSCSSSTSISSPSSSVSYPSSSSSSVYSATSPAKAFGRKRRQSASSSSSSDYSDASPYAASISASPIPRKTSCPEGALLNRLRGLLHDLPSDANAYQKLLNGVTNVMEEDGRWRMEEEGRSWKQPKMEVASQPASPFEEMNQMHEESFRVKPLRLQDVPLDLMSVDVSAFASLIMYQRPM